MKLLAERLVELEVVDSIGTETVRAALEKNAPTPSSWRRRWRTSWTLYHRPYDGRRPMVCLDEASKQLVGEVAEPIPAAPGRRGRVDHEFVRNGTANLFMASEPLLG